MIESDRIKFIVARDGTDTAIVWVRRTMQSYRSSVLNKKHFASSRHYRRGFIESYLSFKQWLALSEPNLHGMKK